MTTKPTNTRFLDEQAHADTLEEIQTLMAGVDEAATAREAFSLYDEYIGNLNNALSELLKAIEGIETSMNEMGEVLPEADCANLTEEAQELNEFTKTVEDYARKTEPLMANMTLIEDAVSDKESETTAAVDEALEEAIEVYDSSEIQTLHSDWFGYNRR